jgi:hypothetical protein
MSDSLSDSGLSLTDAAARLGLSERTVLRRIQAGEVKGRKIGEGHGGVWRVYLDQASDSAPPASDSRPQASDNVSDSLPATALTGRVEVIQPDTERERLIGIMERMQDEHAHAIEQARQEAQHWRALALEAQAEVKRLLSAPKDDAPSAAEPTPPEPAPAQPKRAPWWRQIFNR